MLTVGDMDAHGRQSLGQAFRNPKPPSLAVLILRHVAPSLAVCGRERFGFTYRNALTVHQDRAVEALDCRGRNRLLALLVGQGC